MNKYILIVLSFMFIITACRKEEITEIDTTTVSDPTKIDGLLFKGLITDGTQIISEALIDVYQNEKLVGTVKSNEKGEFVTHPLKLDKDGEVTFYAQKDKYVSYARRLKGEQGKINESNMRLVPVAKALIVPEVLENPGSANLIAVSGQVFKTNGAPEVDAGVLLLYDLVPTTDGFTAEGGLVFTDENGYYEMLLPQDQQFHYLVLSRQGCATSTPILTISEQDFLGIGFQLVGPFNLNTILPTLNNGPLGNDLVGINFSIDGVIKDCQGLPLFNGKADIEIKIGTFARSLQIRFSNGLLRDKDFGFCISQEQSDNPIKVSIVVKDPFSGKQSPIVKATVQNGVANFGDVIVCENIPVVPVSSKLSINFGNINYNINISDPDTSINCRIENDILIMPKQNVSSFNGFLTFKVSNPKDLLAKRITDFRYQAPNGTVYSQSNQIVNIINVGKPSPGAVKCFNGIISGALLNENTNLNENIFGLISICY